MENLKPNQIDSASTAKQMPYFLGIFFFFWIVGVILLALWGYEESFLQLNSLRISSLDFLMPHYTHLGDGIIVSMIFVILVMPKHKPIVLCLIISLLLVSLSILIFKNLVFADWDRPLGIFGSDGGFYYISLDRLTRNSFPSGHSAAAAAMFTVIDYHLEQKNVLRGSLLALLAISIAYSRLYIGVHFLGDILAGTFLGVLLAVGVLEFIFPKLSRYFSNLTEKADRWWSVGLYLLSLLAIFISLSNLYQLYFND